MIRVFPFIILLLICCAEEFTPENPYDPDNPDYTPPVVSIISGPAKQEIVSASSVTIEISGNETGMVFRSRLDSTSWTGWLSSGTIFLEYLDEGTHTLDYQGKYLTEDTSEVYSLPFNVDAVSGPSIMTLPRRQYASVGDSVVFDVLLEEVFDLTGLEFTLAFNNENVSIMKLEEGNIFQELGNSIYFEELEQEEGLLTITNAIWGLGLSGFSGTGSVLRLTLLVTKNGMTEISFNSVEMRDQLNQSIIPNEQISGLIQNY